MFSDSEKTKRCHSYSIGHLLRFRRKSPTGKLVFDFGEFYTDCISSFAVLRKKNLCAFWLFSGIEPLGIRSFCCSPFKGLFKQYRRVLLFHGVPLSAMMSMRSLSPISCSQMPEHACGCERPSRLCHGSSPPRQWLMNTFSTYRCRHAAE